MNQLANNVILRPFSEGDVATMVAAGNDADVYANMMDAFPHPLTEEGALEFIRTRGGSDGKEKILAIEWNDVHVGNIGLHPQSDVFRFSAEIGYFVGKSYWGKGIATEAVRQMVQIGFNEMRLRRIWAGVYAFNESSMRVLEKVGFQKEGVARQAVFKNGEFCDQHIYSVINVNSEI